MVLRYFEAIANSLEVCDVLVTTLNVLPDSVSRWLPLSGLQKSGGEGGPRGLLLEIPEPSFCSISAFARVFEL